MKHIDTDFAHFHIIDTHTVMVEVVEGVEINSEKSKHACELLSSELPGNFGIIVNRKADYSITPIEVYKTLNDFKNLKAIAIVLNGRRSVLPDDTEKNLFNNELSHFQTINEARTWISSVLNN